MIEAIQTLIAAVESGYLKENQWAAWAERALIESASVAPWLVDLHDVKTKETALAALYKGWNKLNHLASSLDQTALLLGFLYLRHLSAETNLAEFLQRTGALCDGDYNDPSCELIYSLLTECEGRTTLKPDDSNSLVTRVDSLFSKHADLARTQFDSLNVAI